MGVFFINMKETFIDWNYVDRAKTLKKLPNVEFGTEGCANEVIMVKNFKHFGGKNCIMSSLYKTLRHFNVNYSEEMLLGLASGVHMIVMQFQHGPFVGGLNAKNWDCLRNPLHRLNIEFTLHETGSVSKAHHTLKSILRKNQPVVTFVDMAFLPHFFPSQVSVPNEFMGHFGGHTLVVYGIDEIQGLAYVSDRFARPTTIPLSLLQMARASKYAPFAPKNRILEIQSIPDSKNKISEQLILQAIQENCANMLHPPTKMLGISGFQKFASVFPSWWKKYQGNEFLSHLLNLFIFLEVGGCGGAMFRDMYRIFLGEAGNLYQNQVLLEAETLFTELVSHHRKLTTALLPDDLKWMKKLRESVLYCNKLQENMGPDYDRKLSTVLKDQQMILANAMEHDLPQYPRFIPRVVEAIKSVFLAEKKAWAFLHQNLPYISYRE